MICCDGKNIFFQEPEYLQDYISPPYEAPKLNITLSIPEKIEGYISINLIVTDAVDNLSISQNGHIFKYKKISAETLYKTKELLNYDFEHTEVEELTTRAQHGDKKSDFLLALNNILIRRKKAYKL